MGKTLSVRMSQEQYEQVETIAQIEGVPIAETIRAGLELLIKAKRHDQGFRKRVLDAVSRAQRLLDEDIASGSEESDALQLIVDEVLAVDSEDEVLAVDSEAQVIAVDSEDEVHA